MIQTRGEKWFAVFNYLLLSLIGFAALYPFLYVLSASLSSGDAVVRGDVLLFPQGLNLDSYREVLQLPLLWSAYGNTIFYTVVGTTVNLLFTVMGAYALSKKRLLGRTPVTVFFAFTLWFQGGMIPFYLNLRDLHLLDSRFAIIIAFAVNTFYLILMRSFFEALPEEIEESAKMDGASDLKILWSIYLPLSKPALATIGLYYAVSRWNGYFWSMIILKSEEKLPLQVVLQKMIIDLTAMQEAALESGSEFIAKETLIYATIVISILPIVIVYPYLQKYFVKGITLGSVKG
jgi:putative aldouronate transport system permease protein